MKDRYSIYPIQNHDIWEFYKEIQDIIWFPGAISTADDRFDDLHPSQKKALKILLFFFVNSDKVVADNIALNMLDAEFTSMEAEYFYTYQIYNENIHAETYSDLIEAYIKNESEKHKAYNAIHQMPVVSRKMKWAIDWLENGSDVDKLVAFACVEGILFSSTFAAIFWMRKLNLPLSGLYLANDFISRDENSHYQFAVHIYNNYVKNKLSDEQVRSIIMGAYYIEEQYVCDYFGDGIKGMDKDLMIQYVQYTTDFVLADFGVEKEFNVRQPLDFMANLAISGRTNFFEKSTADYAEASMDGIDDMDFGDLNFD